MPGRHADSGGRAQRADRDRAVRRGPGVVMDAGAARTQKPAKTSKTSKTAHAAKTAQAAKTQPLPAAAVATLERARDHLLGLQDSQGWWKGELETNVTMDAEDLLMREFLGIRAGAETSAAARWIRSKQRSDGTWANFHGGPA